MNYSYLKKCRGTCLKRKDVSLTNCIGVNPHHKECQYRQKNQFQKAFCPYYVPSNEEKNYTQNFNEITGKKFYRKPFRIIMFYIMNLFTIVFLWLLCTQRLFEENATEFLNGLIGYIIFFSFITLIGNKFFYKNRFLVAVINEEGIYTRQRFINWNQITKVKSHYRIISSSRIARSIPGYLVELEIKTNSNNLLEVESIYIYFSSLEMRIKIRKYLRNR